MNNKVLLYSTENYFQYSLINHNGKEHLERIIYIYIYIYIYITESVCCPADFPDPGIEPGSPALLADSLQTEL